MDHWVQSDSPLLPQAAMVVQGTPGRFSEDVICQAQMLHAVTQTQHGGAAVGTGRAGVARVETHDLEGTAATTTMTGKGRLPP